MACTHERELTPGPAWPRLFCAAGILDHTGNSWPSHPHHFLYGRRCALRAAATLMESHFPGAGLVSEAMNEAVAADANPLQPDCSFIPPVSSLCDQTRCWLNTSLLMVLKLCCVVLCCTEVVKIVFDSVEVQPCWDEGNGHDSHTFQVCIGQFCPWIDCLSGEGYGLGSFRLSPMLPKQPANAPKDLSH